MKTHELKLDVIYFDDVKSGKKNFEIRKNDRDYQVGDILELKAFVPELKTYVMWGEVIDPLKHFEMSHGYISCAEKDADLIKVIVKEVVAAEELNRGEWDDSTLAAMQDIDWYAVVAVLLDYFESYKMSDDHVLMKVEVVK